MAGGGGIGSCWIQCTAPHVSGAGLACAPYLVREVDHLLNDEVEVLAASKRSLRNHASTASNYAYWEKSGKMSIV